MTAMISTSMRTMILISTFSMTSTLISTMSTRTTAGMLPVMPMKINAEKLPTFMVRSTTSHYPNRKKRTLPAISPMRQILTTSGQGTAFRSLIHLPS